MELVDIFIDKLISLKCLKTCPFRIDYFEFNYYYSEILYNLEIELYILDLPIKENNITVAI